jgi:hypothetical protein
MDGNENQNGAVAVVGIVSGVSVAIVVMFAIFVRSQMAIAAWIVGALALMGLVVATQLVRRK